jgi:hypothetical protein
VGTGAVAATGDSGNNVNANTTGPNNLTEPAIYSSPKNRFLHNQSSRDYTFHANAVDRFTRTCLIRASDLPTQRNTARAQLRVPFCQAKASAMFSAGLLYWGKKSIFPQILLFLFLRLFCRGCRGGRFRAFLHRILEMSYAVAQPFAQFSQLGRAKK